MIDNSHDWMLTPQMNIKPLSNILLYFSNYYCYCYYYYRTVYSIQSNLLFMGLTSATNFVHKLFTQWSNHHLILLKLLL